MKHFIRALIFLSLGLHQISKAQNLQISGGNNFSAAVCDNQVVYTWGANSAGQLGVDKNGNPYPATSSNIPLPVWYDPSTNMSGLPSIRQVDAGSGAHIIGLDCDKHVWTWGNNNCAQLGNNTATSNPTANCNTLTAGDAVPKMVLKGDQNIAGGDPIYLSNITYVSGGNNTSFAIEEGTGKVLAWGENKAGQLGIGTIGVGTSVPKYVLKSTGTPLTDIVQIEGGDDCTYALDKFGNVWSWGTNNASALGRPTTGNNPDPYAGQVQLDKNFDANADVPPNYLTGVKQISGGDTHGLALTQSGEVFSFGGDWGPGQRGSGYDYQYQYFAYQVVAPGNTVQDGYKNGPYITGAIFVAAGQASSAVVMGDSTVVTFGANGLYGPNGTDNCDDLNGEPQPSYATQSGTLGNGGLFNQPCASFTRNDNAISPQGSPGPVYVLTSIGNRLKGISSVSDGDAWFYATDSKGNAYTWGFNRNGELGLGNFSDRNFATPFSLPTGCTFANPCPPQPDLRASYLTCPSFKDTLDSQVKPTVPTWTYTWYERKKGTLTWIQKVGAKKDTLIVDKTSMEYKVSVGDSRGKVGFLCDACPVLSDSLLIDTIPSPYKGIGCVDATNQAAGFTMVTPQTSKFVWYSTPSGGSPLPNAGPDDTLSIGVRFDQTDTLSKINGCARGLWAEDTTSYKANLMQTKPCTGTPAFPNATGRFAVLIDVKKDVTINDLSFIQVADGNNTHTYSIEILNNTASNTPGTSIKTVSIGPISSATDIKRTLTFNEKLTPGKYWVRVNGNGQVIYFNCNRPNSGGVYNSPILSTPKPVFNVIRGAEDGNPSGHVGTVFDMNLSVGTGYDCSRIWVCAEDICVLPVQYLSFTGKKDNGIVELNWATASEKDASHFDIERSANGVNFEKIGSVSASGNSNRVIDYSFVDTNPVSGNAYYRLKQVDYNGQYEYSKIININSVKNAEEVQIVPNPNNGSFNVVVTGTSKETYEISVLNALGQPIYSTSGKSESTNITQAVNIQNLASGVYYVRVITGESSTVKQIIKE